MYIYYIYILIVLLYYEHCFVKPRTISGHVNSYSEKMKLSRQHTRKKGFLWAVAAVSQRKKWSTWRIVNSKAVSTCRCYLKGFAYSFSFDRQMSLETTSANPNPNPCRSHKSVISPNNYLHIYTSLRGIGTTRRVICPSPWTDQNCLTPIPSIAVHIDLQPKIITLRFVVTWS